MSEEMARPKKKISIEAFEVMCHLQCTEIEICDELGVTDKTLARWCKETYGKNFSEVFREKRGHGKLSLRRKQWRLADSSPAMAIFLGKNYLGQSDQQEVKLQGEVKNPYAGLTENELRALAKLEGAKDNAEG